MSAWGRIPDGRGSAVPSVDEFGYFLALTVESLYWLGAGKFVKQPVRVPAVFEQLMVVRAATIRIVFILSYAIDMMLAIQGIHTLKTSGAESQVVIAIALAVKREFGPLITGILVAGRSSFALAARIGIMQVSHAIDALRVMGVNPGRYLVTSVMLTMIIMVPALTIFADFGGTLVDCAPKDPKSFFRVS